MNKHEHTYAQDPLLFYSTKHLEVKVDQLALGFV